MNNDLGGHLSMREYKGTDFQNAIDTLCGKSAEWNTACLNIFLTSKTRT